MSSIGLTVSTSPFEGGVNITSYLVIGLATAMAYYTLRKITTNKYVVLVIGLALAFFGYGYLALIGDVLLAIAVSRIIEQDIKIVSS